MFRSRPNCALFVLSALTLSALVVGQANAGSPFLRRSRRSAVSYVATPTAQPSGLAPSPMLGTFYPEPYIMVRGNWPAGAGYSPNGQFGSFNMSIYGPMSALRQYTAPVVVYQRGYDGAIRPTTATSFSNPNLPEINPVVYPTRANFYYAPRTQSTPPWKDSAIYWIDQN
jgi:hypothetical protein